MYSSIVSKLFAGDIYFLYERYMREAESLLNERNILLIICIIEAVLIVALLVTLKRRKNK